MTPEQTMRFWINERHAIYRRRERGERPPWTIDEVLRTYRFTNVSRRFDAMTKRLYADLRGLKKRDALLRVIACRLFNRTSTWDLLDRHGYGQKLMHALAAAAERGRPLTSGVWMVGSRPGVPCWLTQYESLRDAIARAADLESGVSHNSLELAYGTLLTLKNVGRFVANEMLMDLTYGGPRFTSNARDRGTFVVLGPGAVHGLRRLQRRPVGDGLEQPKADARDLDHFRYLARSLRDAPPVRGLTLTVHDVEHCLCEYDKYARALAGAKLKNRYRYGTQLEMDL